MNQEIGRYTSPRQDEDYSDVVRVMLIQQDGGYRLETHDEADGPTDLFGDRLYPTLAAALSRMADGFDEPGLGWVALSDLDLDPLFAGRYEAEIEALADALDK